MEGLRIRQQDNLYISATQQDDKVYYFYPDLLQQGHSGGSIQGVEYTKDALSWYSIVGTAILDSEYTIWSAQRSNPEDSSFFDDTTYRLYLDPASTGELVKLHVEFSQNSSTYEFYYPEESDYVDGQLSPRSFFVNSDVSTITISFVVPEGTTVDTRIRYVISVDCRKLYFEYGTTYRIHVGGGSGTGDIHCEVKSLTGEGVLTNTSTIEFRRPGSVLFQAYRSGSRFYVDPDTGEPVNGYYEQSKLLVAEITLKQRQLTVEVRNDPEGSRDWVYNIGDPIPSDESIQDHFDVHTFDPSTDEEFFDFNILDVFIVNNSYDYYKFDVFSKFDLPYKTDKGIRYLADLEGNIHVFGTFTSSGESVYSLITSIQSLPGYLHTRRTYILDMLGSIPVRIRWYTSDGSFNEELYISSESTVHEIYVDDSYTGVDISLCIEGVEGEILDTTIRYHLFDTTRNVDNFHASSYAVSARGAEPPHDEYNPESPVNFGYDSKIQYRSARLIYRNIQKYRIYTLYDNTCGTVLVNSSSQPYDSVTFTVIANTDYTFDDNFYEAGITSLHVLNLNTRDDIPYEPVGSPIVSSSTSSDKHKLIQCSYKFEMPITNVIISCDFYLASRTLFDRDFPFGNYYTYENYPYRDIGTGEDYEHLDEGAVILRNSEQVNRQYTDALIYCNYARQYFFHENPPILSGISPGMFYDRCYAIRSHAIRRNEVVEALWQISHGLLDTSYENVDREPDAVFEEHASITNTPDSRLFTYAGYSYPHDTQDEETIILPTDVSSSSMVFGSVTRQGPTAHDGEGQYDNIYDTYRMPSVGYHVVTSQNLLQGSNDDYMTNYTRMPSLSWSAWIGVLKGYSNKEAGSNSFVTYQEVANILWRYAQFRQFNIQGPGKYPSRTAESELSTWAQTGAVRWLETHGISTGYHCVYEDYGIDSSGVSSRRVFGGKIDEESLLPIPLPMHPTDNIDRVEFAYMLMRFCQMYAW